MRPPTPLHRVCLAALLASAGTLVSCASRDTRAEQHQRATERIEDPIRALEARAELESVTPLAPIDESIIRRVVRDDAPPLIPGTEDFLRAMRAAEEIQTPDLFPPPPEPASVDPISRSHALKLYARARVMHQRGQSEDAAETLRRAIELDPTSPTLAQALGDALSAVGDSVGANEAYQRAVELGDRTPATLVALASNASALGDQERVMALCEMALRQPDDDDPVAHTLAGILLGTARIREGYLRSGAEELEAALNKFKPDTRDPRWRQEIIQIMGRRPALWVMVGDAWSRVGMHARAARAYDTASELSNGDAPGLTSRRMAQLMREGRPAGAALVLIEHLRHHGGDQSWMEGEWVDALSDIPSIRGVLHDAIASLRHASDAPPSARRAFMALEVRGLSPDDALARLSGAGADARVPQTIARILRELPDDASVTRWVLDLVRANPQAARAAADALLMQPLPTQSRLERLDLSDPDAQLLAASLALRMGRADLYPGFDELEALSSDGLAERSNAWLESIAQVLANTGRWAPARLARDELARRADAGDRDAAMRLAAALMILQQPQDALDRATALADDVGVSAEEMVLLARIALAVDDPELAYDALDHAFRLDPSDTATAERLLRLVGQGGAMEDESALRQVVRTIGQNAPRSELFALLRASELSRNGLLREAESIILELNEHREGDIVGDDLLLSIWKTRQTRGESDALQRGARWLESRLERFPGAVRTGTAVAQIYFELEEYDRVDAVLTELWTQTRAHEVARVHESLVRDTLGDAPRALEMARRRLSGSRGIDASIELARYLALSGDAEQAHQAADLLESNIPGDVTLLLSQKQQLTQVVASLSEHADTEGVDEAMLRIVDLIEDRTGPLDFYMARTKLLLESRRPRIDLDALVGLIEHYASSITDPQQVRSLRTLPAQVLLSEDRPHEAIALVSRMGVRPAPNSDAPIDETMIIETFRLLGGFGENADLLGVLDTLEEAGVMERVILLTTERLGTPPRQLQGLTREQQRADLAYTAAALASAFDRQRQSERFLRLALSFDPQHAWSNNDLGYMLIERGEMVEEAEQMLETAARLLPDHASVIDSLGWLRYKQGIFEDERDPETGKRTREGAITLLTRANRLDTQRTNATILLHLGDALWRAGRHDQAIEAWLNGENMLRSRIRVLSAEPETNSNAIQTLSEELRTLRYRVQDAEAGAEPPVAPILSEQTPETEAGEEAGEEEHSG